MHVAPALPNVPATHLWEPEEFNGTNIKRWQQKMLFCLSTLNMSRFLKEKTMMLTAESDMQTTYNVDAWKHSDYMRGNTPTMCIAQNLSLRTYGNLLTICIKPKILGPRSG